MTLRSPATTMVTVPLTAFLHGGRMQKPPHAPARWVVGDADGVARVRPGTRDRTPPARSPHGARRGFRFSQ